MWHQAAPCRSIIKIIGKECYFYHTYHCSAAKSSDDISGHWNSVWYCHSLRELTVLSFFDQQLNVHILVWISNDSDKSSDKIHNYCSLKFYSAILWLTTIPFLSYSQNTNSLSSRAHQFHSWDLHWLVTQIPKFTAYYKQRKFSSSL